MPDNPLDRVNAEPVERVLEALRACNAAPSFAAAVAAGRPYDSADALVARAEAVSRALPWSEVSAALAAHPRIGDRVEGASAEAAASRREASASADEPATRSPIRGWAASATATSSHGSALDTCSARATNACASG